MKRWLIVCLLGTLHGCAANPINLPDWELPDCTTEVTDPFPLPDLPDSSALQILEQSVVQDLTRYVVTAQGNYDIAVSNAEALREMAEVCNSLVSAGQAQKQFAQVRDEQLNQERRDHFIDNTWHRALIVALAIVLGTQ